MSRNHKLIVRRKGSPNWYCNFTVRGNRFRDSLCTDDREIAEILAAKIRAEAFGDPTGKKPAIRLTEAFARYWKEHGQFLPSAGHIVRRTRLLEANLGKDTLLSEITPAMLVRHSGIRRAVVSNSTVNMDLCHLRAVINRAAGLWGVATPEIEWNKILLDEPSERQHILTIDEEKRLFSQLRSDYHAMIRFALLSGLRLKNVMTLTWDQINWDQGHIVIHIKSKKPGGELHYVPITRAIAEILLGEMGNHPKWVFTNIARKGFTPPKSGNQSTKKARRKGERYPFNLGFRRHLNAALKAARLRDEQSSRDDFRFHDFRHTAATRLLRVTGNIRNVQRLLGHKDIKTTLRYLKTDVEDVRRGMEQVAVWHKSDTAPAGQSE